MPRFHFRLQPLLRHREHQERLCMIAVAQLEREAGGLRDQIRACQERMDAERAELRRVLTPDERAPGAPVALRVAREQAGVSLRAMLEAQRLVLRLAGVQARLDVARAQLARAMTQRKAVEVLRDHAHEAWAQSINRAQTAEQDDLASIAFTRAQQDPELAQDFAQD